jgi:hypothetical protein
MEKVNRGRRALAETSLHGIATNLLAERLRTMEANGLVERRLEESGVAYGRVPGRLRRPSGRVLRRLRERR